MSNPNNIKTNSKTRIEAIEEVYGMEKVLKKQVINLSNGEIITSWAVEGFETFDDLKRHIPLPDIEAIYDSSM